MRLFIAVDLDEALRGAIVERLGALRRSLEQRLGAARANIRWVSREQLHLTLRFLGDIGDEQVPAVRALFAAPFKTPSFEMELTGVGVFPSAGAPRVIWLDVLGGSAELSRVYQELDRRLQSLAIPPEDRPFRAHLTLGRLRERGAAAARRLLIDPIGATPIGSCRIEWVTLYHSQLSPKGATYVPLARAALGAGSANAPSR